MLILRTNLPDGSSLSPQANGFRWPLEVGTTVVAPDWSPEPVCGYGLHGWAWGQGQSLGTDHAIDNPDAIWIVFEAEDSAIVNFDGKVKAKEGIIRFVGPRKEATDYLIANTPRDKARPVIGASLVVGDGQMVTVGDHGQATAGHNGTAIAGDHGQATAGYHGQATAGYHGTATAGDHGTATAGDGGTASAGDYGTATAGYHGQATAGHHGTATAGYHGTATAGNGGTATAGDYGQATAGGIGTAHAGYHGTATAGDGGTASAGNGGTASAGDRGEIHIKWWDDKAKRFRTLVGYIGEVGLEPDVPYKVSNWKPEFVKA